MGGQVANLVQVESAFHELRSQRVLLLGGVQVTLGVQKTLGEGPKHLPQPKVVPVGLLSTHHISS